MESGNNKKWNVQYATAMENLQQKMMCTLAVNVVELGTYQHIGIKSGVRKWKCDNEQ